MQRISKIKTKWDGITKMAGLKVFSWAVVILWMILIFNLSSQIAEDSNRLSTGVAGVIVKTIEMIAPKADIDPGRINHLVRKNAHFFAYFVLGLLTLATVNSNVGRGIKSILLSFGICLLFAISDEVHQLFIPGRGGQVRDVIIDGSGAAIGLGIYLLFRRLFKGKRKRSDKIW